MFKDIRDCVGSVCTILLIESIPALFAFFNALPLILLFVGIYLLVSWL